MHIYIYIYVYKFIYGSYYIYIYICICIHIYIYIYTYIHIFMYCCAYWLLITYYILSRPEVNWPPNCFLMIPAAAHEKKKSLPTVVQFQHICIITFRGARHCVFCVLIFAAAHESLVSLHDFERILFDHLCSRA